MAKQIIGSLVLVPLSLLLVLFALANRHMVPLKFDPLMSEPPLIGEIHVPLFLVIFLMLIAGILLGGIATWFSQSDQRRQKRDWRNKAEQMENELNEEKKSQQNTQENKALFDAN